MIDVVNRQGVQNAYSGLQTQSNNKVYKEDNVSTNFNIREILSQIKDCTYREEDVERIDKDLVKSLQDKFSIDEEDVYRLQSQGFDLEMLYVEDYSGYNGKARNKKEDSVLSKEEEEELEDKLETIKNASDNMYLSALTSGKDITINSLYESNYKGSYKKSALVFKESDVANILNMNGLENNEQNTWAARMLLEYGMDVSVENVRKLDNIQTAVDSLDAFVENEKRIEELEGGTPIGDRLLVKDGQIVYDYEGIKSLKYELGQVTEEDIKEVLDEGKTVSIKNLKEVMYKNTELALNKDKALTGDTKEITYTDEVSAEVSAVKEQINQIRAKLTAEAAQKISEKMPLESSNLNDVVNELLSIEDAKIEEALISVEAEVTPENKQMLQDVLETKVVMMEYREETLGLELTTHEMITLEQIKGALSAYGENESVAEKRFGETIQTVEDQIQKVLENQGIKVTEESIAAAKALITNGMEVTPEQINHVLEMTVKMNTLLEDLTPTVAAKFIKEGMNPYKASVDNILEWMSEEKIAALKGSVAEAIVALEEQGQLSEAQKETMLGLYRIMQAVDVNREEVIGYLYKNNLSLTIEHLQEATKYVSSKGKKNHVAVNVDDSFGEVSSKTEARTAKGIIEGSREDVLKTIEVTSLLEDMELALGDDYTNKLQKINAFLYPLIKEQFKLNMGQFEGMSTLPASFLEKLETIQNANPEVVEEMIEKNIPLTVSNIYWMDKINEHPDLYADLLKKNNLLKEELPEHLEELEQELIALEEKARAEKEAAMQIGDMTRYRNYKQMEEVAHTQKQLIDKEGIYQIPFMIDGEQKLINLYVQKDANHKRNNENSSIKAVISYETKNLGHITASVEIKDEGMSYKIEGENENATEKLRRHSEYLKALIEGIGYQIYGSEYHVTHHKETQHVVGIVKRGESAFEEII